MAPKHELHKDQGSFLATPGQIAVGGIVRLDEGYFRAPVAELSQAQNEEIVRLKARHSALDRLAAENRSWGNIVHLGGKIYAINQGLEEEGEENSTEGLAEAKAESEEAVRGLKLASKGSFGDSIGIKTIMKAGFKKDEDGAFVITTEDELIFEEMELVTIDETDQARLDAEYSEFREEFFGTSNYKKLIVERRKIRAQLKEIRLQSNE
jgi:hypothetical protein